MRAGVEPLTVALEEVCFLHWPVDAAVVDARTPDWLEPDTADGSAWVSALPLEMARFDAFGLPVRQGVRALNLRTYVRSSGGDRGVYFLSLDATDRLAVETARRVFALPYYHADIERTTTDGQTAVSVARRNSPGARFEVTFEPSGPVRTPTADTLASFLCERYRYFTEDRFGTRLVGSVGHDPWSLQSATATVTETGLVGASDVPEPGADPLAHYSPGTKMRLGPPLPLSR